MIERLFGGHPEPLRTKPGLAASAASSNVLQGLQILPNLRCFSRLGQVCFLLESFPLGLVFFVQRQRVGKHLVGRFVVKLLCDFFFFGVRQRHEFFNVR